VSVIRGTWLRSEKQYPPQGRFAVDDRGSRLGFYASVLVPVLLFGGYGIASWNVLAVVFALVGLFIFVGWRISRELAMVSTYRSLCQKIVEHERALNL
jgi:hypothetical protein